jgi:hypothetical protein
VWGHVRALRHETYIAQIAVVDDFPVIAFGDAVDLHCFAVVDQIEQGRKRLAKTEAAPTAVTDVKHPLQLALECRLVVETLIKPVQRVAFWGFQAALAPF